VSTILAIDPGPVRSAWLVLHKGLIVDFRIDENEHVRQLCKGWDGITDLVIEQVASYGMPVGAEVFETVFWSGRFAEAAVPRHVHRITRKAIVTHLCGSARAKDSNVRQALIDRFGGSEAIGRKARPGPLYGVTKDVWAALAVAVTFDDDPGLAA
jgi:hypothetical protein